MIRRSYSTFVRAPALCGCLALIVLLGMGPVAAEEPANADHGQSAAEESSSHGSGHHDPYDLSAANAGPSQKSFTELRADLALATLVVFMVLLAILWKFAWGPITDALDRREKGIADQLAEARRNNEEAHRLLAEHRERLDRAAEEVRGMLDQARKDGDALKQRMVTEAEQAANAQKDRALREIDAAKNSALEELARKSIDQAVGLAGQIIGKQLKKEDHSELIQEALERLPSRN